MPDAVPRGGGAGVVLTGVGVGAGFTVGFALADFVGVAVADDLVDGVVDSAALDELPPNAPAAVALEAAALETAAPETALDTAPEADEAASLPEAPVGGPVGAAWW